jgi:hypothetical protein
MLNFNRYKDCGDGVFEYTTLRHNNVGNGDSMSYFNVPWGGVRKSTLSDLVVPFTDGERQYDSLPSWGTDNANTIFDISKTDGYVMFPEDLPDLIQDGDPFALPDDVVLTIAGGCQHMSSHSTTLGLYTIRCRITSNGVIVKTGTSTGLRFTSSTTGDSVTATNGVHHWAWNAQWIYFFPDVSAADVSAALPTGSVLTVTYYITPSAKSAENNLALGHVFGTNNGRDVPMRANTRMRWGGTSKNRDFQVYTINTFPTFTGGMTYYYRQYFMVDRFEDMRATGLKWAPEAHQALYEVDASPLGRSVELFEGSGVFGAVVGMAVGDGCSATSTGAVSICRGSTTPKPTFQALYQVKCGSTYVLTNDPYYFAPNTLQRRPYVCDGQPTERPEYKLLGFFDASECVPVASDIHFEEDFC